MYLRPAQGSICRTLGTVSAMTPTIRCGAYDEKIINHGFMSLSLNLYPSLHIHITIRPVNTDTWVLVIYFSPPTLILLTLIIFIRCHTNVKTLHLIIYCPKEWSVDGSMLLSGVCVFQGYTR